MSHRRKSSHPLCKQKRLGLVVDRVLAAKNKQDHDKQKPEDSFYEIKTKNEPNGCPNTSKEETFGDEMATTSIDCRSESNTPESQEKGPVFHAKEKPNFEIPEDLLTDFEALKSATHLDTATLMRKLIQDYSKVSESMSKANTTGTSSNGVQDMTKLTEYYIKKEERAESMEAPLDLSVLKPTTTTLQKKESAHPSVQFVPFLSGVTGLLPSAVCEATETTCNVRKGSTLFPTNIESPKTPKMAMSGMYLYTIGGQTFPLAFSPTDTKFPSLLQNASGAFDPTEFFPVTFSKAETTCSSVDYKIVQNIKNMEAMSRKHSVATCLFSDQRHSGSSSVTTSSEKNFVECPINVDNESKMPQLSTQTSVVNSVNHPITAMNDFVPEMGQITSKDNSEHLRNLDKLPVLDPKFLTPLPSIPQAGQFMPFPLDPQETDSNANQQPAKDKISDAQQLSNSHTAKNVRCEKGRGTKKNTGRMKLLAENMSTKGVYTSVLKLPWSKRTRTAKTENGRKVSKQLVDQDQHPESISTVISESQQTAAPSVPSTINTSQPMVLVPLDSASIVPTSVEGLVFVPNAALSQLPNINSETQNADSSVSTQPMMMVYPNSTFSSASKPARKRGRPPKAPVLAKMLNEANKLTMQASEVSSFIPTLQQPAAIVLNVNSIMNNCGTDIVTRTSESPIMTPSRMSSVPMEVYPDTNETHLGLHKDTLQSMAIEPSKHSVTSPSWNITNTVQKAPASNNFVNIRPRRQASVPDQGASTSSDSGPLYQEMILSSKSLVNVQPRRRQTTTELIQSKAGNQDFICTSFRLGSLNGKSKKKKNLGITNNRRRGRPPKKDITRNEMQGMFPTNSINDQNKFPHYYQQPPNIYQPGLSSDSQGVASPINEFNSELNESMLQSSGLEQESKLFDGMTDGNYDNPIVATQIEKSSHEMQLAQEEWQHRFVYASDEDINNDSSDRLVIENSDQEEESSNTPHGMFQKLFHCKLCNEIIPVNMKNDHWNKHTHSKTKCKSCAEVFLKEKKQGTKEDLCDKCEKSQEEARQQQEINPVQTRIVCDFCNDNVADIKELKAHIRQTHPASYHIFKAKLTGIREKHNREMQALKSQKTQQANIKSNELKVYECPMEDCSKKVYSKFGIKHHIKKRHETALNTDINSEVSKTDNILNIDKEEETVKSYNVKGYKCLWPGCTDEFSTERNLKVHLLVHKDEKPLKCDFCDYRCRQQNALQWHTKKHHPEAWNRKGNLCIPDDVIQEMDIQ